MSGNPFMPPAAHIRRGTVVVIDAAFADWLVREARLGQLWRARGRDADRAIQSQFAALLEAATSVPTSDVGGDLDSADPARSTSTVSACVAPTHLRSGEVAALLGIEPRSVTAAAAEGRLDGELIAGQWWIDVESVGRYRPRRTTRKAAS